MKQYIDLLEKILEEGEDSDDRTGTGTRRIFGHSMKFDCSESFPLLSLKYTHFDAIVHELLWFIAGGTNTQYLRDNNVTIWDEWALENGDLGPIYGAQWRGVQPSKFRKFQNQIGVDQLAVAIEQIKNNPTSRRIIVDSWNPEKLPSTEFSPQQNVTAGLMALAPCHMMFHFFVGENKKLDVLMYQRSVDTFLGLPFNIASYALLLKMVAHVTGTTPGTFTWMGGDCHIYNNHMDQVGELLQRYITHTNIPLPTVDLNPGVNTIDDFAYQDIILKDYISLSSIKAPISV